MRLVRQNFWWRAPRRFSPSEPAAPRYLVRQSYQPLVGSRGGRYQSLPCLHRVSGCGAFDCVAPEERRRTCSYRWSTRTSCVCWITPFKESRGASVSAARLPEFLRPWITTYCLGRGGLSGLRGSLSRGGGGCLRRVRRSFLIGSSSARGHRLLPMKRIWQRHSTLRLKSTSCVSCASARLGPAV